MRISNGTRSSPRPLGRQPARQRHLELGLRDGRAGQRPAHQVPDGGRRLQPRVPGIAIDYGMGGEYMTRVLDQTGQFRGWPKAIRTDDGPEFISRAFMAWVHARGFKHLINDAGNPTQNAYIESSCDGWTRRGHIGPKSGTP